MALRQTIESTGLLARSLNVIPQRCEKCKAEVRPVWGNGRAALKCSRSECEWEMSATEYAQKLHEWESEKPIESGEEWDE